MTTRRTLATLLAGALLSAGCFSLPSPYGLVDRAVGRGVDSAADRAGQRVGDQVGAGIAAKYNPMLSQIYMQMVFSMAFGSGGYSVGQTGYRPGEYTRWSIPSDDSDQKESTMERAYLFDDRDGNPWWKVKWVLDPAKASESTLIVEALFEKGTGKLLRQRAKMPNEQQGKEIPVEDATYYQPPRQLTKQSLEGATIGVETVTVPAGTFKAKHVSYGDMSGTVDFWLADTVPGSAVKYLHAAQGGSGKADAQNWQMLLVAYGKGATSELGITR
jgi:hypothetical protein